MGRCLQLWCASPQERLGADSRSLAAAPSDANGCSYSALAAAGESVCFQLAFRTSTLRESAVPAQIRAPTVLEPLDSSAPSDVPITNTWELFQVRRINGVPDMLVPLPSCSAQHAQGGSDQIHTSQLTCAAGEVTAVWLCLALHRALPPGRYVARLCVEELSVSEWLPRKGGEGSEGGHRHTVSVAVTVFAFQMPPASTLPFLVGVDVQALERVYGVARASRQDDDAAWSETERHFDAIAWAHFEALLRHRMCPYFYTHDKDMAILACTTPYPVWHPRSGKYLQHPLLPLTVLSDQPLRAGGCTSDGRSTTADAMGALSPSEALRKQAQFVGARRGLQEGKGLPSRCIYYLWDEPVTAAQYVGLRERAQKVHEAHRGLATKAEVITTVYRGPPDELLKSPMASNPSADFTRLLETMPILRGTTQILCVSEWALGGRLDGGVHLRKSLQANEEWWAYVCMGPGSPHPNVHLEMEGLQHRAVLWRAFQEGCDGFLYWAANATPDALKRATGVDTRHNELSKSNGFISPFRSDLPDGDGVLIYPSPRLLGECSSSEVNADKAGYCRHLILSVRLQRLLLGLQDWELFHRFGRQYGRSQTIGLLHKMGVYKSAGDYARNDNVLDKLRVVMAAALSAPR